MYMILFQIINADSGGSHETAHIYAQSHESLRCSHTQSMDFGKGFNQTPMPLDYKYP